MHLSSLSFSSFQKLYPRMLEDFPEAELKTLEQFQGMFKTGLYHCYGLMENDIVLGMALGYINEKDSVFWLDFLEVFQEHRGRKCGSKILNLLLHGTSEKEPIICTAILLEVEKTESMDPQDQKVKRMRFYHRFDIQLLDSHYLLPTNDGTFLPMGLYYLPGNNIRNLTEKIIQETMAQAYQVIYPGFPRASIALEINQNQFQLRK